MSGETNHNENRMYSAEDLRRYVAGEMPAAEMHALEQASLEDPMLDDALEGMRNVKPDTREDLAGLKRRLTERATEKKRAIPLWRSPAKIAAAVVLLIGLSGLGYFLTTRSAAPKDIAITDQKAKSPAATAVPPLPSPSKAASAAAADSSSAGEAEKTAGYLKTRDKAESTASNAPVALARAKTARKSKSPAPNVEHRFPAAAIDKDDRQVSSDKIEKKNAETENDERISASALPKPQKETLADSGENTLSASGAASRLVKDKAAPASVPELLQGKAAGIEASPATNRETTSPAFSGQVLDDKGQAVAGALVQMGKSATITDIQGKFSLSSVKGDSNHLDFSSVGYQSLTLIPAIQHRSNITVTLSPAATALNDVVVTGYSTRKKSAASAAVSTPAPARGWKTYRNYLGANKIQPIIDSSLHGTEKVTFSITRNGEPTDFVVDQSLSSEHDSVTVRIIRNGPKWKPARDSTRRISLALPF